MTDEVERLTGVLERLSPGMFDDGVALCRVGGEWGLMGRWALMGLKPPRGATAADALRAGVKALHAHQRSYVADCRSRLDRAEAGMRDIEAALSEVTR